MQSPQNDGRKNLPSTSSATLQELLQESTVGATDEHLLEFSDALRTVAKALRSVAEGKAQAVKEAAEWKRKYELEWARNMQQLKDLSTNGVCALAKSVVPVDGFPRSVLHHEGGHAYEMDGICSQDVLDRQDLSLVQKDEHCLRPSSCCKTTFRLSWGCDGMKGLRHNHDVVSFENGNIKTAHHSSKQIVLEWDSPPKSVVILTKPNSAIVDLLCKEMISWLKEEKNIIVFAEPHVKQDFLQESPIFSFVQSWETDEELQELHTKVDLVITLGGDGTVLWAASMFKGPVPPMISFAMGSLGFMTPFHSERYKESLQSAMKGPLYITLRHRLICKIIHDYDKDDLGGKLMSEGCHLVLNEVSIDRGMSPFLTYLECYCDHYFVTCVQGDGLILSTTSGSTAYSLAAGGSMVHPEVPGILFTPICPHSLSFRPLILPEYVTIRVQVPFNSRGQAWASFDGKDRQQLKAGDALLCCMSCWPVPTACEVSSTHDFLRSVREGLHWNLRKPQSTDGPHDVQV